MATSDVAFAVKTDGRTFTLDRLTLGDFRMLKREFGLLVTDITLTAVNAEGQPVEVLNYADPEVLTGLMVAALTRDRPNEPLSVLIAEVDALALDGFEFLQGDDDEEEADPTKVGAGADDEEAESLKKSGSSAKPRKKPGIQS